MKWVIVNKIDPELCWNNQDGWQPDNCDIFTDEERETLNLPFDGEWKCIQQSKEGMDS